MTSERDPDWHEPWHPASAPFTGTPAWEWVATAGVTVTLAALTVPSIAVLIRKPTHVARFSTYTMVVGVVASVVLLVSLFLRRGDWHRMSPARRSLYVAQWVSYALFGVVSVWLIFTKYLYAMKRAANQGDCVTGWFV